MASTLTNLLYHIVFSTKLREETISQEISEELFPYIGGIINGEKGKMLKIGGTGNHIHILTRFSPTASISDMLRKMKGNSSRMINEKKLTDRRFSWQTGYAAFSVSESASEAVIKYIETQKEHHKKMTFKDEFLLLLKKHNVEYDKKYIWD